MTPHTEKLVITVSVTVRAPSQQVWDLFTEPLHIIHWNHASDDWQTSYAESDFRPGGAFLSRMEARDGSEGFDFTGKFSEIVPGKSIASTLDDGRNVHVSFHEKEGVTLVTESFEAEDQNSAELQRNGWQAILNNFKKYVEGYGVREMHHFEVTINSTPDNIFRIMLGDETYSKWTTPFNPDSRFTGSWDKGERILFHGTDSDGRSGGMLCRIRENIPGKFVSIESLREIIDGREVSRDEKGTPWQGALENYTLKPLGNSTLLCIDTDVPADFSDYIREAWPKALDLLKSLCE
jgi:uncharacterized protein YndB with AHSA1/START domain